MKSNGGVLSAEEVVHQPITTVLSGPAAGALGAARVAEAAGFDAVLTLDGGGTSTDVTVVVDGQPTLTTEGSVGAYPCKIPMIDVVTVGAGGGSVAWISPEGTLKVGPRSAGADPGPLCYGAGRHRADGHRRAPGARPDPAAPARRGDPARRPRRPRGPRPLADELGLGLERCAAGVLEISAWNQANALRQITVQRGLDVRDFTAGHVRRLRLAAACRLVDILGLRGVLVPATPATLSAFGLLTVDVRTDHVRTAVARRARLDPVALEDLFAALAAEADAALEREGFAEPTRRHPAHRRPALLRPGLRGAGRRAGRARRRPTPSPTARSTTRTGGSTATTSAGTTARRSSGSTCGSPGSGRSADRRSPRSRRADGAATRPHRRAGPRVFDGWHDTPHLRAGPPRRRATS